MPELTSILSAKRESDYQNNKFLAALQGVDIEENNKDEAMSSFEDIKARVFSGGSAKNSKDILSMQGINAQQAGFGIGMGLEYNDLKSNEPTNPFG
jgi:hypothetical protein